MNKRKLIRWLKVVVLLYCIIGIALYSLQEKLMFRPVSVPKNKPYNFTQPHKEVNIPYNEEINISIVQFEASTKPAKGVVLYFHGNRNNIAYYARHANTFTRNGYEAWMLDYPGYGKSTGKLTEQTLYDWALLLYKLARTRFKPDSIIIYGKSMGTGIAAQLASVRDCRHLVLETPYYNFPSVIGQYAPIYPLNSMIKFKMPNYQFLPKVTAPITIFHGTNDWVIRYRNGKRLQKFLKQQDEFVTIEGGSHNNLSTYQLYGQKMDSILSR